MTKDDDARARAAAILAKLQPPASAQPASVLKPAPVEPSMSVERAKTEMAAAELPPIDHDAFDPDRLAFHPAFPPPIPPLPTRVQRFVAWFNTPLLK